MNIRYANVNEYINSLSRISQYALPMKISFAISRNLKTLYQLHSDINDKRMELLKRFAKKDDNGKLQADNNGDCMFDNDSIKKDFQNEYRELLSLEEEIEIMNIGFEDLEKCDSDKYDSLSVDDLLLIQFMIED